MRNFQQDLFLFENLSFPVLLSVKKKKMAQMGFRLEDSYSLF